MERKPVESVPFAGCGCSEAIVSDVHAVVRDKYAALARGESCGCTCCAGAAGGDAALERLGYSPEQIAAIPEGANLGLGCGSPLVHAQLKGGETVLDLGSGAGADCFLAGRAVGERGHVIGVDMTPAMIDLARANAARHGATNVEFRLGEIEHLPVADGVVDLVISNCVINLSPEQARVFREAHRVLRKGGALLVSDLVLERPLSTAQRRLAETLAGCVAGAALESDYVEMARAGFAAIEVLERRRYDAGADAFPEGSAERAALESVVSLTLRAVK
jgi:SAM-dependent methyltransferase